METDAYPGMSTTRWSTDGPENCQHWAPLTRTVFLLIFSTLKLSPLSRYFLLNSLASGPALGWSVQGSKWWKLCDGVAWCSGIIQCSLSLCLDVTRQMYRKLNIYQRWPTSNTVGAARDSQGPLVIWYKTELRGGGGRHSPIITLQHGRLHSNWLLWSLQQFQQFQQCWS